MHEWMWGKQWALLVRCESISGCLAHFAKAAECQPLRPRTTFTLDSEMEAGTYAYSDLQFVASAVGHDKCLLLIASASVNASNKSKGAQGLKISADPDRSQVIGVLLPPMGDLRVHLLVRPTMTQVAMACMPTPLVRCAASFVYAAAAEGTKQMSQWYETSSGHASGKYSKPAGSEVLDYAMAPTRDTWSMSPQGKKVWTTDCGRPWIPSLNQAAQRLVGRTPGSSLHYVPFTMTTAFN